MLDALRPPLKLEDAEQPGSRDHASDLYSVRPRFISRSRHCLSW